MSILHCATDRFGKPKSFTKRHTGMAVARTDAKLAASKVKPRVA